MSPLFNAQASGDLNKMLELVTTIQKYPARENQENPEEIDELFNMFTTYGGLLIGKDNTHAKLISPEGKHILSAITLLALDGNALTSQYQDEMRDDILRPVIRTPVDNNPPETAANIVIEALDKAPFVRKGLPDHKMQPQHRALTLLRECVRHVPSLLSTHRLWGKLFVEAGYASDEQAASVALDMIRIGANSKATVPKNEIDYAVREIRIEARIKSPVANKACLKNMFTLLQNAERAALDVQLESYQLQNQVLTDLYGPPLTLA